MIGALAALGNRQRVIHTGQHYDERLSDVFFVQLGLPEPDVNLGVGSGSHAQQTAAAMTGVQQDFTSLPAGPGRGLRRRELAPWPPGWARGQAGHPGRARRGGPAQSSTSRCRKRSTGGSPMSCPA